MMRKTLLVVVLSVAVLSTHVDCQCSVTPCDDVILSPQQAQVKEEGGNPVMKPDDDLTFNSRTYTLSVAQREQMQDCQASLHSSLSWIDKGTRSQAKKGHKTLDKITTKRAGANSSMYGHLTKLDAQLKEQMSRITEHHDDSSTFRHKAIDQVRVDD